MAKQGSFGWTGIALGGVALMLELISFTVGPFAPQPTIEGFVATKVVAIKKATVAALQGKEVTTTMSPRKWDTDRVLSATTAVLALGAILCGAAGGLRKENYRVATAAALLGVGTIVLHLAFIAFGFFLMLIILAGAMSFLTG